MGITGLIPFLEKASSRVHLKDLRGCTVTVDTYCWLHKGAFGCADKLVRGEATDQYWQYCMRYLDMLLSYNIKPILVFDGQHLPAKALTEKRRRESRQQSRKLAAELLRKGKTEEARTQMRRCVDITHEMALQLIRECRRRNIDCIVAPYEADAQMAWLNKMDLAQYVITEDSDLTLFGANRIIFKLDLTGAGLLVEADKLHLAMGCQKERYNFEKFRRMCILSGCDYLDSLPGIGLAKACKFILKTEDDDMWRALKKIPSYLKIKNLQVDDEYIEQFLKAEATFRHMYIYNPIKRCMQRLNELAEYETEERYCVNAGSAIDDKELALQMAVGNINPFTRQQLDNWHPDKHFGLAQATNKNVKRAKHKSIWQKNYQLQHNVDLETAVVASDNCALYFKKVDIVGKTINDEITANVREEHAKPEESEIFSLYQHEVEEQIEPSAKRLRRNSVDDEQQDDDDTSIAPIITSKSGHNPFAKTQATATLQEIRKQSAVCENASLLSTLNTLSPKKPRNDELTQNIKCVGKLRKSSNEHEEKVTVKSRFFAANIKDVTRSVTLMVSRNLSDEIDEIENQSLQVEETRAQLYDSPSPKKACISKDVGVVINQKKNNINNSELENGGKPDDAQNAVGIAANILEDNSNDNADNTILLSDEEAEQVSESKLLTPSSAVMAFKSQAKQRLGLPKSKTKLRLKPTKSSAQDVLQNQTRLTMFGFKKRPTLK